MDHYLCLDGEADELWQELTERIWGAIVSKLLLDAYHEGKLDAYLSASESSPEPVRAKEHKVEGQKAGKHNKGSGGKGSL